MADVELDETASTKSEGHPLIVIFGASCDLARRLIFPALYRLFKNGRLGEARIVGYALESWDQATFLARVHDGLELFAEGLSPEAWVLFAKRLRYRSGHLDQQDLSDFAAEIPAGPALFYLALPPGVFAEAAKSLAGVGCASERTGWRRLIVEKPFGIDLASAEALNQTLHRGWREEQIFRIDHFLGKDTVQNLLVFRFANRFLDPVLNAHHVAEVQITAAETLGLEGRYRYYDRIGALRDMIQNHLIQLFTLIAIEPPALWDAEVLRNHKVEVLKSVRPISESSVDEHVVRGQYSAGRIGAGDVPGYLEEKGVAPASRTETFAAIKLRIDSWRWQNVPFYLRTGKRLRGDLTEIALRFRDPPAQLFRHTALESPSPNWLVFKLKPTEAVEMTAQAKRPGLSLEARSVALHADYSRAGDREASAYEQLLLDAMSGDHTPFLRVDEVEWAWRILEPVLRRWGSGGAPDLYAGGSAGPETQTRILEPGCAWRPIL